MNDMIIHPEKDVPPTLNDLMQRFSKYIDVKNSTMQGYLVCLRCFLRWLGDQRISTPDRHDVMAYKSFLEGQNFTAGTQAQYLRSVKHFFRWTASEGLYPNIADGIKCAHVRQDNTRKEDFSEDDIRTILKSIDTTSEIGKRNYAMILLAVTGGLREVEMQRCNVGDLQTIKGQKILYIQGKGRDEKDAYVKIIPEMDSRISDYLQSRESGCPLEKTAPLFASTSNRAKGRRMEVPSISRILKQIFRNAGYDCDKLTGHSLRHTSNTVLFKAGADLFQVQQHARHADPRTTEIYLHAVDREKDRSEEMIYNQIFQTPQFDTAKACNDLILKLPGEKQARVLEYIHSLMEE